MMNERSDLPARIVRFKEEVWDFYRSHKRSFSWRETKDPYHIVVSEVMLQQTQTSRVEKKFSEFIAKFPDFQTLAAAERSDVLSEWVGLGYNRRGVALHEIARRVVFEHDGLLPCQVETLKEFRGLGHATASSIVAFAFNRPTIFIETNVRAVFLHTFYPHEEAVHDKMLLPLIELTVDKKSPREWYYALMDYGVFLKKQFKNPSRRSKHHTRQSEFQGSDRQIRGAIIRFLAANKMASKQELFKHLGFGAEKVENQLQRLLTEEMIRVAKPDTFSL